MINGDPINDPEFDPADPDHNAQRYYAMQDANYNVMGIVDEQGELVERYEYTPYGQRSVFRSSGSNDPQCMSPTYLSHRVEIAGVEQPYGLNEVGFQGLQHDEHIGALNQRWRIWNIPLARFNQPDPAGTPDGPNRYAGYHVLHGGVDPMGLDYVAIGSDGVSVNYVPESFWGVDQTPMLIGSLGSGGNVVLNGAAAGSNFVGREMPLKQVQNLGNTSQFVDFVEGINHQMRIATRGYDPADTGLDESWGSWIDSTYGSSTNIFDTRGWHNLAGGAKEAFGNSAYAKCWRKCMGDKNKQLAVAAAGTLVPTIGGGLNTWPAWPAPKPGVGLGPGRSISSMARYLSYTIKNAITEAKLSQAKAAIDSDPLRQYFQSLANQMQTPRDAVDLAKSRFKSGLKGGVKAGVVAATWAEAIMSIQCGLKCKDCPDD